MLRGRHGTGAVLAAITVAASIAIGLAALSVDDELWQFVWALPLPVGVAAFFSAGWSFAGLAAAGGVQWFVAEEILSRNQPDPLDGLIYLVLIAIGVLGLAALAVGSGIGWWFRRQRLTPSAGRSPQDANV